MGGGARSKSRSPLKCVVYLYSVFFFLTLYLIGMYSYLDDRYPVGLILYSMVPNRRGGARGQNLGHLYII